MKTGWMGLVLAAGLHCAQAELTAASPFTDHAVLQRDLPVPVWGRGDSGERVTVEFAGQKKTVTVDSSNHWKVVLNPMPASSKPRKMTISSDSNTLPLQYSDLLVGDVWICTGQSNMDMEVHRVPDVAALGDANKTIRSFQVKKMVAFEEQEFCEGEWLAVRPDSAVAYAFAHALEASEKVPVGILLTSWGSASIEGWSPRAMMETTPHFKTTMDKFDADKKTHDRIQALLDGPEPWSRNDNIFLRTRPNILYNAMMHPLVPFACRGVVWYQGEQNARSISDMVRYGEVLKQWMQCYRQKWGRSDLHFLIVMLPGYGTAERPDEKSWAWMREAQLRALELPHAGVANTIDLGDVKNIHPTDKLPIGERLALLAERDVLGRSVEAQGPVMETVKERNGSLIVHFDHAKGLTTHDGEAPAGFWIADQSAQWVKAEAKIKGTTVVLSSEEIKKPRYVRYAFTSKPAVNLVNKADLPAVPFRTDPFTP
jgi:sialate O-acetylesterase